MKIAVYATAAGRTKLATAAAGSNLPATVFSPYNYQLKNYLSAFFLLELNFGCSSPAAVADSWYLACNVKM